ncbi:TerC family protein [candidate division KSB1 bacterium]
MGESALVILTIAVLEGLLSADNALVLAVLVRGLPKNQQQKALIYGIGGALVFRFLAILSAATLIQYWYLQLAGALYLAYLAVKHFSHHVGANPKEKPVRGFWTTVLIVEFTDIAFAIDSILAAVGLTREIWLIYTGGILGLIFMRFAAGAFIKLLERFPLLEHSAYMLIAWIAIKLGLESMSNWQTTIGGHWHLVLPQTVFWGVAFILLGVGFLKRNRFTPGKGEEN